MFTQHEPATNNTTTEQNTTVVIALNTTDQLISSVNAHLLSEMHNRQEKMTLSQTFEAAPFANRVAGSIGEYVNQSLLLTDPTISLEVISETLLRTAADVKALSGGVRLAATLGEYLTKKQAYLAGLNSGEVDNHERGEELSDLRARVADAITLFNTLTELLKDAHVPASDKLHTLSMVDTALNAPLANCSDLSEIESVTNAFLSSAFDISVMCCKLNLKKPEFQKTPKWRKLFK